MNYLKGVLKISLLMGKICISKETTALWIGSQFIILIYHLRGAQLLKQEKVI